MTAYRNVASLIVAVMLLQAASGVLSVSTPLALDDMGASALGVGIVAAVFSAGFMVGAWFAPDAVRRVGHIRAYSAAAALYASGILGMALAFDPVAWGALRLLQGAGSAILYAAAESWMADSTPRAQRGAVMGFYQVLIKLAMSGGPLLVIDHAPDDVRPFIWAALLMILSLAPLCLTRRAQPVLPERQPVSPEAFRQIPPAALAAAIIAGVANTGVMSQLPLFAAALRPLEAQAAAAQLAIAAWMGGVVLQWPAGLFSDRVDRRIVVAVLAAVSLVASLVLFLTSGAIPWGLTVALCALWGGGAMSFYPVAAAYASDEAQAGRIAQTMSAMLFVWAAGSVVGPVITGLAADSPLGREGIFALATLAYLALCVASLWGVRSNVRQKSGKRSPFSPVGQTSVVQAEIASDRSPDAG
jgi:MFS family permease